MSDTLKAFLSDLHIDISRLGLSEVREAIVSTATKIDDAVKLAEGAATDYGSDALFPAVKDASSDKRGAIFGRFIERRFWSTDKIYRKIVSPKTRVDDVACLADGLARSNEFESFLVAYMDASGAKQGVIQRIVLHGLINEGRAVPVAIHIKGDSINTKAVIADQLSKGLVPREHADSVVFYRLVKKAS